MGQVFEPSNQAAFVASVLEIAQIRIFFTHPADNSWLLSGAGNQSISFGMF
jgi:hypothetical protein